VLGKHKNLRAGGELGGGFRRRAHAEDQRTGARQEPEEGNRDGQDGQDEGGVALLEPEAEAPGPVKTRVRSPNSPFARRWLCSQGTAHLRASDYLNERVHVHRPVAPARGSNDQGPHSKLPTRTKRLVVSEHNPPPCPRSTSLTHQHSPSLRFRSGSYFRLPPASRDLSPRPLKRKPHRRCGRWGGIVESGLGPASRLSESLPCRPCRGAGPWGS
jgi:hypothetical protein